MALANAADQEAARRVITFDTGALIAIERRRERMLRVLRAAEQTTTPIVVPAVVLAEWWRERPSRRMALLLDAVVIEPVSKTLARMAGEAIAAVAGATTIDALIMASAAARGGVVYTSNLDDLMRLGRHFPEVRVLGV